VIRHVRILILALTVALLPRAVHAQFALDADLRRAIQTYQSGKYEAAATELGRLANSPSLTTPDRAVAFLYRGFALLRLKRDSESSRALELAVVLDPTLRPDPVSNSAELLDAWRRARLRVPLVSGLELSSLEFVPGLDSARITYNFETPAADRRYTAQVRFLLLKGGSTDTVAVWSGTEGQVPRWDGTVRGQPISPGVWELILEARAPGSEVAGFVRRRADVEIIAATSDRQLPIPVAPRMLPETVTFNRVDDDAKATRITRGLWMVAIGSALALYSNSAYQKAIDETPKGSGQRMLVAGSYVGGLGLLGVGAWYSITGWRRSYETPVAFPSTENVRRNREMRQQYSADSARVSEHNRALSAGRLVRLRFIGEGAR
jgi:hypothetical protein